MEHSTITCWGNNYSAKADAPEGTFKTVTAGHGHNCAIATDDTITCWGGNYSRGGSAYYGQADPPQGTFKSVAAGHGHNCAIATDDTITCWGPKPSPESPRVWWRL